MTRTTISFGSASQMCCCLRRHTYPDILTRATPKRLKRPVRPVMVALVMMLTLCLLQRLDQQQLQQGSSNHHHRQRHRFYFTCRGLVSPFPRQQRHRTIFSRNNKGSQIPSLFTRVLKPESPTTKTITTTTTSTTMFGVVIDPPPSSSSSSFHRGKESNNDGEHNNDTPPDADMSSSSSSSSSSWIPTTNGGFLANIPHPIRLLRWRQRRQRSHSSFQQGQNLEEDENGEAEQHEMSTSQSHQNVTTIKAKKTKKISIPQVTDLIQYKKEVVDVSSSTEYRFVAVRFYAPWCKACRAIEQPFRRLATHPDFVTEVKFVEVPVTKDNAYLHQGLGIPSLPFAHIYQVDRGTNKDVTVTTPDSSSTTTSTSTTTMLVEEMKINKHVFSDFQQTLHDYVQGECSIEYNENDGMVQKGKNNKTTTNTNTNYRK